MKKYLIFITACLAACLLPFVGMAVCPATVSTENKKMSSFPTVKMKEGGLNWKFFQEFENYFQEHFAFRNELIYADAKIQGSVFQVSNTDGVIYGTDGWLYYSATLDDYLGRSRMSERQIYNLAHNLSVVWEYVQEKGSDFVVAVPPNKNTLYGQYMPYYHSLIVDRTHNVDLLAEKLKELGVPYADLLQLFRNEEEILYLKRDSHWNGKGAVLAYNCLMDTLGYAHMDYKDSPVSRAKNEDGDLNRMLYTFYGEKELNYKYDTAQKYTYVNDVESVEDVWIGTEGGAASATLLMFRDSFGNTLIPLLADQFKQAWFTKELPYGLEKLMEQYDPDTVVFEKVERNISEYLNMPPIISAVKADTPQIAETLESDTTISIQSLEYDFDYYKISGSVEEMLLEEETDLIVQINDTYYKAYHKKSNEYELYIKKKDMQVWPAHIKVLVKDQGISKVVQEKKIEKGDILP